MLQGVYRDNAPARRGGRREQKPLLKEIYNYPMAIMPGGFFLVAGIGISIKHCCVAPLYFYQRWHLQLQTYNELLTTKKPTS